MNPAQSGWMFHISWLQASPTAVGLSLTAPPNNSGECQEEHMAQVLSPPPALSSQITRVSNWLHLRPDAHLSMAIRSTLPPLGSTRLCCRPAGKDSSSHKDNLLYPGATDSGLSQMPEQILETSNPSWDVQACCLLGTAIPLRALCP